MKIKRKPPWLKIELQQGKDINFVENIIKDFNLNTVCKAAKCPNRAECYNNRTATFLILGTHCTRGCRFCNIDNYKPLPPDLEEPKNISLAVKTLGLKYIVITSVTRDDLTDGGAEHFSNVTKEIYKTSKDLIVELLIPDLKGNIKDIQTIIDSKPKVINHNMETVKRLYPEIRIGAEYNRSLDLLKYVKKSSNILTKSGIILGMGETDSELIELLKDLRSVDCDLLTMGQYLAPTKEHLDVDKYVTPLEFDNWKEVALDMGFKGVQSGPFVRSSYNASELVTKL